jgi:ABC-type branched-subunit amino acid transport system ATPase component
MSESILTARGVIAGYVPGLPILHGVSLEVAPGEIVTIIGPNGAGKSTMLKALAGLLHIDGGVVIQEGKAVGSLPTHDLVAAGLAFVPQTGNVFASLTIHENLVVGGHTLRGSLKERLSDAYALFPDLVPKRNDRAGTLSGGQRQMLAIARSLMTAPKVIMLDEPTAGLAPKLVMQVFADLRRLAERGVAILMVEQNARAALQISDRGYVLTGGRNFAEGKAEDLLADETLAKAFLGARTPARKKTS